MAKDVVDVRALAVIARIRGDEEAIELLSKMVTLLADRRSRKKSSRR